uniref:Uncharacterized protein n=1 Tax=Anguilla anguilla TaxID=7936 RepID=A0A0E9SYI9_ANGAN
MLREKEQMEKTKEEIRREKDKMAVMETDSKRTEEIEQARKNIKLERDEVQQMKIEFQDQKQVIERTMEIL